MRSIGLIYLLVASALILPVAFAAPASGHLRLEGPLAWEGVVDASTSRGFTDLGPSLAVGAPITVEWTSASGYEVTRGQDWIGPPPTEVRRTEPSPVNRSIALSGGRLVDLECKVPCHMIVYSDASGGRIVGDLPTVDGLKPVESEVSHYGGTPGAGAPDSFFIRAPIDWVKIESHDGSDIIGVGRVSIYLWNVTGAFETSTGRESFVTGWTTQATTGPGGVTTGRHEEGRFVVFRMTEAAVRASGVHNADIFAPAVRVAVDGAVDVAKAIGRITTEQSDVSLNSDRLRVEGSFVLDITTESTTNLLGTTKPTVLLAAVSGDITNVVIDGEAFAMGRNVAPLVAGAFIVALLGILAALGPSHLPGIPFYTRIERSNTLRNPNRKTIYETIVASPGENVASIVRATELTEVVVRHHLKMLEMHKFVISRGEGRQYAYFAVEQQSEALEADAFITLRDATRRLVAETLLQAPRPMSQKDLAAYLDISQRLVSHHIIKLESEGLVDSMGSMPRRYFATSRLTTVLGSVGEAVAA